MKKIVTLLLLLLGSTTLFAQTIYHVKPTGSDANDGLSWATAFRTVQKAINTISSGQIWVAAGTYYPDEGPGQGDNNRGSYFTLKTGVALYGGFAGSETILSQRNWQINKTILSGDIDGDKTLAGNAYHVTQSSSVNNTAILDGFTITGGNANGNLLSDKAGAGMYNYSSSPTIRNCIFTGNSAYDGGGMYNSSAHPSISNCIFTLNISTYGGGVYNDSSTPIITNCSFSGNAATNQGGAIYNHNLSSHLITNCILWGNSASQIFDNGYGTVTWSIVQGGYSGTGNLDADPLFVNQGTGDLHLQVCSPAIDAGSNTDVPAGITADLDRLPRIVNSRVDMGAYEFQLARTGNIIYVNDKATGNNNGTSWANAFTALQDALAQATTCTGTQIWVAAGTYYPDKTATTNSNLRSASFVLKAGVALYGGFAGTETALGQRNWRKYVTILSGEIQQDGIQTNNSYQVVKTSSLNILTVLDGFTVTGGYTSNQGAGMYNYSSSPTIRNCIFTGNRAYEGGGMYNSSAHPSISHCIFTLNTASNGGGVYNVSSTPVITNCSLAGNLAIVQGGGIYNTGSSPSIINSILASNRPSQVVNVSSSPSITWSIVQGGYSGTGNLDADPLFVNQGTGDLHLQVCSPAIDAGSNTDVPAGITADLDRLPRIVNSRVDMGAYEFQSTVPPPSLILFVDSSATGNNNGTSWANAFTALQDALAQVGRCSGQIWVAAGTYYPDETATTNSNLRERSFTLKNGVSLYGGFAGTETELDQRNWQTNVTVLSGEIQKDGNPANNAYRVVQNYNLNSTAVLDGFTITGGYTEGYGGGMYNSNASPTISNCTFTGNRAERGGGMYNRASVPTISYCSFTLNSARAIGGGLYDSSSASMITHCIFTGNSAGFNGGAMAIYSSSASTVANCSFWGNTTMDGAGISIAAASPLLANCRFWGNNAARDGGVIYDINSSSRFINCSFWGNTASYGGAICNWSASMTITNCIFWGNTGTQIKGTDAIVSYSIVQGGYEPGTMIIDQNPMFVDTLVGNLHLQCGSPAIDAGNTDVVTTPADLDGQPRIVNGRVDMGAYELQGVFYVKGDASGSGDGTSWANAFTKLQDALAMGATCTRPVEIWVAAGTYYPDEGGGQTNNRRESAFTLKNGVALYGGFAGNETERGQRNPSLNETILSGDLLQNDGTGFTNNADNAYHVVRSASLDHTAVLDGFTIKGGNANGFTGGYGNGGGLYNYASSPTIAHCTFVQNYASFGGGICNDQASSPLLANCSFTQNTAGADGGGLFNNNASSPTLTNCRLSENKAYEGGALYNNHSSSPVVTNCSFTRNGAQTDGGALYNYNASSPTLINCTFWSNTASRGGGLFNGYASATLTNCILWGNSSALYHMGSSSTITYSIVQGGYAGTGNLDADPLFRNAPNGNLQLQLNSPAINAGNDAAVPAYVTTDLDGKPRFNGRVDLGAYEFVITGGPGPTGPLTLTCPEDYTVTADPESCGAVVDYFETQPALVTGGKQPITVTYEPASGTLLPVGENTITVTATDGAGTTKACSFTVTVVDAIPPVITPPFPGVDVFGAHTDPDACWYTTPAGRLDITATDNCPGPLAYFYSLSGATTSEGLVEGSTLSGVRFNKGETLIHYLVRDGAGNEATYTLKVIVSDYTSPRIIGVSVDQPVLYPPNHQMQVITVNYTATDNCLGLTTSLSVSSNEAVDALGDGHTDPDWEVIDDHHVRLRAERSGRDSSRVYTITIIAKDAAGFLRVARTTVTVPHDNRAPVTSAQAAEQQPEVGSLTVQAVPNPFSYGFTLHTQSPSTQPLTVQVLDAAGRVIENRSGVAPNGMLYLGSQYRPGAYHVQVLQGDAVQTIRLIKQAH